MKSDQLDNDSIMEILRKWIVICAIDCIIIVHFHGSFKIFNSILMFRLEKISLIK